MEQLEGIVRDLETGSLPLELSLKKFEEGIKMSNYCAGKLDETEKKIRLLIERSDGSVESSNFSSINNDKKSTNQYNE